MESNKRHKTENNFRRDSFSDRFCDDLCEYILQYLPLEVKLRLQCVSKQFQRTIFVKQTVLDYNYNIRFRYNSSKYEALIKKMPNICQVLDNNYYSYEVDNYSEEVMDLIIRYCHKITRFEEYKAPNDYTYLVKFLDKFGPQLVSIKLNKIIAYNWQSLTNIEELSVRSFSHLPAFKFNRLKRLYVSHVYNKDLDSLEVFLQLNGNTITHFDIKCFEFHYTAEEEDNKVKRLMNITKYFKNLIHFGVYLRFGLKREIFCGYITQLSLSFPQLKSIGITYCFDPIYNIPEEELLSPLRQLKHLRRLSIAFLDNRQNYSYYYESKEEYKENIISFNIFKGLQQLTHLYLECLGTCDVRCVNIYTILPNLQHIQ